VFILTSEKVNWSSTWRTIYKLFWWSLETWKNWEGKICTD